MPVITPVRMITGIRHLSGGLKNPAIFFKVLKSIIYSYCDKYRIYFCEIQVIIKAGITSRPLSYKYTTQLYQTARIITVLSWLKPF